MATAAELGSTISDIQRKIDNAKGQLTTQQENLKRQQEVQKYNLEEAAKFDALAAAAANPTEQATMQKAADYQRSNAKAIQGNIDRAQQEVTGWQSQIDELTAALTKAQSDLEVAKEAEAKASSTPTTTTGGSDTNKSDDDKSNVVSKTSGGNSSTYTTSTGGNSSASKSPIVGTLPEVVVIGNRPAAPELPGAPGKRTNNPLADFSSYTYKISLYMMSPGDYNKYMSGDYSAISNFKLIAQSGGANSKLDSPRAPGFDLDFYIDDLDITTYVNSKETQAPTNSLEFKFKIYEPYGFTFVNKITKAQIASQKASPSAAAGAQASQIVSLAENFFFSVKFYGYGKDGNLITGKDYPQADINKTDEQSVFERGFPIRFKDFKFKLENKITVYNITAVQVSEQVAKGQRLGKVPAKLTLSGETVYDVLVGKGQDSSKKNIIGLAQALNDIEEKLLKQGKVEFKNEYVIEFEDGSIIPDELLVPKDYYVKERAPMATIQGSIGSNARTEWKNRLGTVDKKIRTIEVSAGTPIVQLLDQVISQSEYLKNMMIAVDKEINQPAKENGSKTDKNSTPRNMYWYNIATKATIVGGRKDEKRKDYAYKITYIISEYEIPYIRSLYTSKTTSYYGAHKKYDYWYTGKNNEILSYEQDFNFLFQVEGAMASMAESKNSQSAPVTFTTGQKADSTNSKPGANDVVNSIKSFLYSPDDLMKFKLKILGDPDYLMPSIGYSGKNGLKKWYGDDLNINPNTGQVFIEIYFEQAEDYDNTTGLLPHDGSIQFMNYPDELKTKIKGMTYMVTKVNSSFSKGKFEQTINGIMPEFTLSGGSAASARPDQTPPPNSREQPNTPAAQAGQNARDDVLSRISAPAAQGVENTRDVLLARQGSKKADDDAGP